MRLSKPPMLFLSAGLALLLAFPRPGAAYQENAFTDRAAMELLDQMASGLVAHSASRFLDTFDLNKMDDGALFRQRTISFFSQVATIRVHFNLAQTSGEGAKGVVTVDMEMDAERSDDRLPPVHKRERVHLVAESSGGKWRFTDLQPRTFFSLEP